MATRTKTTPFARLLLVILFVAPIAFVGGSYYNREDPVANLKSLFGIESNIQSTDDNLQSMSKDDLIKKIESLESRIEQLESKLATLASTE